MLLGLALLLTTQSGCRTAYYSVWETFGKHKRDLLKENVEEARDDQQAAAEQFKDALTQLKELYNFQGGDLENQYNRLQSEYDQADARANAVRERIREVERVAADLFKEWESELATITSSDLRRRSEITLRETRQKYDQLHRAMLRAEKSMEPVLAQLRDQVLFLKHNLNAQAVGALKTESLDIEKEITTLIRDMNAAISEANAFIESM